MTSRTRALWLVTAAVALAHAAVLWGLPSLSAKPSIDAAIAPPSAVVMQTRTLKVEAPPPVAEPPVTAPPEPVTQQAAPPRAKPRPVAKPKPAPEPDSLFPQAETAAPAVSAASEATPESTPAEPVEQVAAQEQAEPVNPTQEATPAVVAEPAAEPVTAATTAATAESENATALPPQVTLADGTLLPPGTVLPVKIPEPIQLEFEAKGQVKGFEYTAGAQLLWRHDGSSYELTQSISMFLMGTRAQTSTGRLTDHGLEPQSFADKGRKPQTATFDVAGGTAHFSGGTPDAKITQGVQDRVSVFLQLASLIAAAPERYAPGSIITLTTSSARHADRWSFKVVGVEDLRLPVGSVQALRLEKLPSANSDLLASLWLATEYNYLPVRIRLNQGSNDYVDLRLKSHSSP